MKLSKASPKDIDVIFNILNSLDSISNGEMPEEENEEIDIGWCRLQAALEADKEQYVSDDDNYFIRQALKHLLSVYSEGNPITAIMNLAVLTDPENEIIDPDKSTLELHPKIANALEDTKRLDWIIQNGARIENDNGETAFYSSIDDISMARGLIGIRDEISSYMQQRDMNDKTN